MGLNFQFFPMRSRNLKVPKIREFEMYMGQNIENRILILRYDSQIKIPWFGTYTAKKFGRNCMARLSQVKKKHLILTFGSSYSSQPLSFIIYTYLNFYLELNFTTFLYYIYYILSYKSIRFYQTYLYKY